MRLTKPAPPPEIMSALSTGLKDFVEPNDPLAGLPYHEAHEVFSLGLDKAKVDAVDLKTATSTGWRFMASGAGADLGCHVGRTGGTGPKFMGVTRTPEIHVLLHRLRQVDEHMRKPPGEYLEKQHDQDYELRALRIPGLLIEAFWLHCPRDPEHDHVVPHAGFLENVGLVPIKAYPAKEFFDKVREAAKRRWNAHKALYGNDPEYRDEEK
jgi:hypothetical protein